MQRWGRSALAGVALPTLYLHDLTAFGYELGEVTLLAALRGLDSPLVV